MERPWFVRFGIVAWSFVGIVVAGIIVVTGLTTVSSVVLPLVFAAVLAVLFRPVATRLEQRRFPPSAAVATVLAGLSAAIIGFAIFRVRRCRLVSVRIDSFVGNP